jgi:outer membrane protein assembly factor BamD (BamD/ComL family)
MNRSLLVFVLATSATLWGCSSAESDWNRANAANTVAAYQQFLSNHPTGPHSPEATDRIHALQDEQAWAQAKQTNSLEAYRDYVQQQPAGAHLKEAQEAVTAAQRAADWTQAQSKGTVASIQDFLNRYPAGTEAEQARTRLEALSGYKVQLASTKTQKQAEKVQEHLRSKYRNMLQDVLVVTDSAGKGYRVESTPMSHAQADSACAALEKSHQSCKVIETASGKS